VYVHPDEFPAVVGLPTTIPPETKRTFIFPAGTSMKRRILDGKDDRNAIQDRNVNPQYVSVRVQRGRVSPKLRAINHSSPSSERVINSSLPFSESKMAKKKKGGAKAESGREMAVLEHSASASLGGATVKTLRTVAASHPQEEDMQSQSLPQGSVLESAHTEEIGGDNVSDIVTGEAANVGDHTVSQPDSGKDLSDMFATEGASSGDQSVPLPDSSGEDMDETFATEESHLGDQSAPLHGGGVDTTIDDDMFAVESEGASDHSSAPTALEDDSISMPLRQELPVITAIIEKLCNDAMASILRKGDALHICNTTSKFIPGGNDSQDQAFRKKSQRAKQHASECNAAVAIQSKSRQKKATQKVAQHKSECNAAVAIQPKSRQKKANQEVQHVLSAAQSGAKGPQITLNVDNSWSNDAESNAAVKIQSKSRQRKATRKVAQRKLEGDASVPAKFKSKQKVEQDVPQKGKETYVPPTYHNAAIKIQAKSRQRKAVEEVTQHRQETSAAVAIQSKSRQRTASREVQSRMSGGKAPRTKIPRNTTTSSLPRNTTTSSLPKTTESSAKNMQRSKTTSGIPSQKAEWAERRAKQKEKEERKHAALQIQKANRRKRAQQKLEKKKAEKKVAKEENDAALKIQSKSRARKARQEAAALSEEYERRKREALAAVHRKEDVENDHKKAIVELQVAVGTGQMKSEKKATNVITHEAAALVETMIHDAVLLVMARSHGALKADPENLMQHSKATSVVKNALNVAVSTTARKSTPFQQEPQASPQNIQVAVAVRGILDAAVSSTLRKSATPQ
jgi:hypothetical protein